MLTEKHRRFAEALAEGMDKVDAYALAGYKAVKRDVLKANACRLSQKPGIKAYVKELRDRQSEKSEMTRDAMRRFLIEVLQTPIGEINVKHRLCQVYRDTPDGREVRMPDKLRAASELIKLCGWAEPEKVEVETGDKLRGLLERLRK